MSKPFEFELEHFQYPVPGTITFSDTLPIEEAVAIANAKLKEWLDASPTIYLDKIGKDEYTNGESESDLHTHKAKLVCIEEVEGE